MSTQTAPQCPVEKAEPVETKRPGRHWLVGSWFDLLFLANLSWPVLFLLAWNFGIEGQSRIQFWQVYFVTTPHRWITLGLVFLDRDRFWQRPFLFSSLAVGAVTFCLGVQLATGQLTCLLMVDYVWNAWHFSAQHHDIYRIYDRISSNPSQGWEALGEKWLLRGYLLYVTFRVAMATWATPEDEPWLATFDVVSFLIPAGLLLREFSKTNAESRGRTCYLASVLTLYGSLLWAVHTRQFGLVLILTTLSALAHATEYLAIVGWSVQQRAREQGERMGVLGWLAPRWGLTLSLYLVVLGSVGWMIEQDWFEVWLLINVMVAFLHYAYDGLLWRRSSRSSKPVPAS